MGKNCIHKQTGLMLISAILFMTVFSVKVEAVIESLIEVKNEKETDNMSILDIIFIEEDADDLVTEDINGEKPQEKPEDIWGNNDLSTSNDTAFVLCDNVNIRELPDATSKILGKVNYKDKLSILKKQDGFYQISTSNGTTGWVADFLIAVIYKKNDIVGNLSGKTIVLDAGHGEIKPSSVDPGAIGIVKNLKEVDVTIDIATKAKDLLVKDGATVIMTRTGESTVLTNKDRAGIANYFKSDIFISIHTNASDKTSVNGTSTYFYAPNSNPLLNAQREERKNLATNIQTAIVEYSLRKDRGLFEENFAVIRETQMPSVLIETAFISNVEEEELLSKSSFRSQFSKGIHAGIVNYFK